jgi:hypothetical protein
MPETPPHRDGIPASKSHEGGSGPPAIPRPQLSANDLLDQDISRSELERLGHDGLFVMAEASTKRNGGGHECGGNDNALQTLHGLLSFG